MDYFFCGVCKFLSNLTKMFGVIAEPRWSFKNHPLTLVIMKKYKKKETKWVCKITWKTLKLTNMFEKVEEEDSKLEEFYMFSQNPK
jgi:hypothetical protein